MISQTLPYTLSIRRREEKEKELNNEDNWVSVAKGYIRQVVFSSFCKSYPLC
jgi:hypothetical protein